MAAVGIGHFGEDSFEDFGHFEDSFVGFGDNLEGNSVESSSAVGS